MKPERVEVNTESRESTREYRKPERVEGTSEIRGNLKE